jgi:hypothetical protein
MSTRARARKVTFSVAIEPELKAALVAHAKLLHGGNMSELVAEMGRQSLRLAALERMLARRGGSRLTDEARADVDAELEEGWRHAREHGVGSQPARRRRTRA